MLNIDYGRELQFIANSLKEDVGDKDYTACLIDEHQVGSMHLIAKEDCILCGTFWFEQAFVMQDPLIKIIFFFSDRQFIKSGDVIATVFGPVKSLLTAERVALNFLQMLSGTATTTKSYVEKVASYNVDIVDSRKTIPGFRMAQKYAVRVGGGLNHRYGLWDGILIKENHIAACGGIETAYTRALKIKAVYPSIRFIQVEVENLNQFEEALSLGVKMILLDNMSLSDIYECVKIGNNSACLEVSGNVTISNIELIAQTGVHRISIGALTKNIHAVDLSLLMNNHE